MYVRVCVYCLAWLSVVTICLDTYNKAHQSSSGTFQSLDSKHLGLRGLTHEVETRSYPVRTAESGQSNTTSEAEMETWAQHRTKLALRCSGDLPVILYLLPEHHWKEKDSLAYEPLLSNP